MDQRLVYVLLIINVLILVCLVLDIIKHRKSRLRPFRINLEIIGAFETWFSKNISLLMIRYIGDKTGTDMVTDDELHIGSKFVLDGINYVSTEIIHSIPNAYQSYMTKFYGEDKFINMIHEHISLIFIEYVDRERKKRLNMKPLDSK